MAALLVGHCAGMLDLVALPVWVGAALIGSFKLDAQQAGLLASLFLAGQVVSSLMLAPYFGRIPVRLVAVAGFAVAALSFLGVSRAETYLSMALLHFAGGLGTGCALSLVHGTMGRTANPHRMFAAAGFALALFGIFILGGGSQLVAAEGGRALFVLFATLMLAAAVTAALAFPRLEAGRVAETGPLPRLPPHVWLGMLGMALMALAQATIFSFVERIGVDRGYGASTVTGILLAAAIANMLPGPLAGALQRRLPAESVVVAGPLLHATAVFAFTHTNAFAVYACAIPVLIGLIVFTHIFLFGLLARLDPSGRALAGTPAMVMIGAAFGPVLGGLTVKLASYSSLGVLVAVIGLLSALCFLGVRSRTVALVSQKRPA